MTTDKKFPVLGVAALCLSGFILFSVISFVAFESQNIGSTKGEVASKEEGAEAEAPKVLSEDERAAVRYANLAKLQEEDAKALEGLDAAMGKAIILMRQKSVKAVPMTAPPIPTNIKSPGLQKKEEVSP